MQKRRERIEKWRAERKREQLEANRKDGGKVSMLANLQLPTAKKWSLEDDSDEEVPVPKESKQENKEEIEEKNPEPKKEEEQEEEIDPLDAYMAEVQKEVKKVNNADSIAVKSGKNIF